MVRSVLRSESVDLEAAAAWTETMAKGDLRTGLTNDVTAYATRADPENALAMLHRLEADSPAYGVLARQWYARNPEQASAWLDSLEPGAKQDAALVGVIHEMFYDRHYGDWRKGAKIEALPLIVRVVDPELRMEQLRYLFLNVPQEEAERLMDVHQVRSDERVEILKQYETIVEKRP